MMAQPQFSRNVRQLLLIVNELFDAPTKADFIDTLTEYNVKRDIREFAYSLQALSEMHRLRLAPALRRIVPLADLPIFDRLFPGSPPRRSRSPGTHSLMLPSYRRSGSRTSGRSHASLSKASRRSAYEPRVPFGGAYAYSDYSPEDDALSTYSGSVRRVKFVPVGGDESFSPNRICDHLGFGIHQGPNSRIYISHVDLGSWAEQSDLMPGDQLVSVNHIRLRNMTVDEAMMVLNAAKRLDLVISPCGALSPTKVSSPHASLIADDEVLWVSPDGRPVSPPCITAETSNGNGIGVVLFDAHGEMIPLRRVNVRVRSGHSLGLMIRGGIEFGLGIYITGVDRDSIADEVGFRVGDQLVEVGGRSFLKMSNGDAVRTLRSISGRSVIVVVASVGKVPHSKATRVRKVSSRSASRDGRGDRRNSSSDENLPNLSSVDPNEISPSVYSVNSRRDMDVRPRQADKMLPLSLSIPDAFDNSLHQRPSPKHRDLSNTKQLYSRQNGLNFVQHLLKTTATNEASPKLMAGASLAINGTNHDKRPVTPTTFLNTATVDFSPKVFDVDEPPNKVVQEEATDKRANPPSKLNEIPPVQRSYLEEMNDPSNAEKIEILEKMGAYRSLRDSWVRRNASVQKVRPNLLDAFAIDVSGSSAEMKSEPHRPRDFIPKSDFNTFNPPSVDDLEITDIGPPAQPTSPPQPVKSNSNLVPETPPTNDIDEKASRDLACFDDVLASFESDRPRFDNLDTSNSSPLPNIPFQLNQPSHKLNLAKTNNDPLDINIEITELSDQYGTVEKLYENKNLYQNVARNDSIASNHGLPSPLKGKKMASLSDWMCAGSDTEDSMSIQQKSPSSADTSDRGVPTNGQASHAELVKMFSNQPPTSPNHAVFIPHRVPSHSSPPTSNGPIYTNAPLDSADGTRRTVVVVKTQPRTGLSIEDGSSIDGVVYPRIKNIEATGCAHESDLHVGDVLVSVEAASLAGLDHKQAGHQIAKAFRSKTDRMTFEVVSLAKMTGFKH